MASSQRDMDPAEKQNFANEMNKYAEAGDREQRHHQEREESLHHAKEDEGLGAKAHDIAHAMKEGIKEAVASVPNEFHEQKAANASHVEGGHVIHHYKNP